MKKTKIFYLLLLAFVLGSVSCREEQKIADDIDIPGLGGTEEVANELDNWLYDNFTKTYNIDVVYRWDAAQMYTTLSAKLVPVEYSAVKPMMAAIRDVWFEPYLKAGGPDFLKRMAPKKVVLVGSPEYQGGSIKLGQAEGGQKILLLNANNFDPTDETALKQALHTIMHEFAHILHQTIMFDKTFQDISVGFYNSSGWKNYDASQPADYQPQSWARGFTRNYGMSGKDEDFVEVLSMTLVFGLKWFEEEVLPVAAESEITDAEGALRQKLAMVEEYMLNAWGIQFLDDDMGNKGLESYVQEAVKQVVANPPTE